MSHTAAHYVLCLGEGELREKAEELYLAFQMAWLTTIYPEILGLEIACLTLLAALILGAGWPAAAILSILVMTGVSIATRKSKGHAARKEREAKNIHDQVAAYPALNRVLAEFCAREEWLRLLWEELKAA